MPMSDSRNPGEGAGMPNFDEIKQVLEFDPFSPPASEGSGGQGETPAEPAPPEPPAAPTEGQPAPQPAPSAAPPQPGGGQPEEGDLRKLIADQRALIESLQRQAQPAQAQPQGEAAEPAFQPVYTVDLPREVFQALGSDDENTRYRAMDGLVKGIMNTIAHDTQRYVQAQIAKAVGDVQTALPSRVQEVSAAEQMRQDFYRAYPALANPLLGEVVRSRLSGWAQAEAQRNGGRFSWTADFRDRAGQALHAELGIPLPGAGSPPPPAPTPTPQPAAPAPRRASFASGGNSGSQPNGPSDNNPFADILF
jgi:hypothetical protein